MRLEFRWLGSGIRHNTARRGDDDPMVALSGALAGLAFVLVVIGAFSGTGFVYASIVASLAAAAVLPLGAARYADRNGPPRR